MEGSEIERVGAILSTTKVALAADAGAVFPAVSKAVPAAIEIPSVPFPVMPEMVTVRAVLPVPLTLTVPAADPAGFSNVISPAARVTVSAPV